MHNETTTEEMYRKVMFRIGAFVLLKAAVFVGIAYFARRVKPQ